MDSGFAILIFILAAIALAVFAWYAAAQRRKKLLAWAQTRGLQFHPSRDYGLDRRFAAFACLRKGDNQYAFNRLEGDWGGRKFLGFDYHYETYSHSSKGGRRTHHHYFSAVILASDIPLKPLFLRPERFFDKLAEFVGYDDIDFESAEFSRKFYVKSPEKRWAYDVFHPRTMEFLLASPMFTLEFAFNCVIAYRSRTFKPPDFESAAEVIGGVLDRLPEYLVRQLRDEFFSDKGTR